VCNDNFYLFVFYKNDITENAACFIVKRLGFVLGIGKLECLGYENGVFGEQSVAVAAALTRFAELGSSSEAVFIWNARASCHVGGEMDISASGMVEVYFVKSYNIGRVGGDDLGASFGTYRFCGKLAAVVSATRDIICHNFEFHNKTLLLHKYYTRIF
jgi:hypothetical protein